MERIFHQYRHSRRDFLERGVTFAAGGLAAALAQQTRRPTGRRPQRVAVIGAGHYHATLAPYYLKILQDEKLDIV